MKRDRRLSRSKMKGGKEEKLKKRTKKKKNRKKRKIECQLKFSECGLNLLLLKLASYKFLIHIIQFRAIALERNFTTSLINTLGDHVFKRPVFVIIIGKEMTSMLSFLHDLRFLC